MQPVTITNKQVIDHHQALMFVAATNGLAAVKLSKIRAAVKAAHQALTETIDALAKTHATLGDDGKPVPKIGPVTPATETMPERLGEPQFFRLTNTPAYEMVPDHEAAFIRELDATLAAPVVLTVARLTELDVSGLGCAGQNGVPQPIPEPVAAAVACFTDVT